MFPEKTARVEWCVVVVEWTEWCLLTLALVWGGRTTTHTSALVGGDCQTPIRNDCSPTKSHTVLKSRCGTTSIRAIGSKHETLARCGLNDGPVS